MQVQEDIYLNVSPNSRFIFVRSPRKTVLFPYRFEVLRTGASQIALDKTNAFIIDGEDHRVTG
jgi:hypothetical protein